VSKAPIGCAVETGAAKGSADSCSSFNSERQCLDTAIEALSGPTKRRGRTPKECGLAGAEVLWEPAKELADFAPKRRTMSASGRKAIRDAVKRRWAATKAGKPPKPFAAHREKAARKKVGIA
jgi:hypothetical protein